MTAIPRYALVSALLLTGLIGGCGDSDNLGGGARVQQKSVLIATELQAGVTDQIGSINVTLELPDGVTVSADLSGRIPQSALYLSGNGATFAATPNTTAILIGKFTPATQTTKAKVSLAFSGLANSSGSALGMSQGEFATLVYNVDPGISFPSTTVLPLSGIDIANSHGALPHLSDTVPPSAWISYQIQP